MSFSSEDGVHGRSGEPSFRVVHLDLKGGPPRLSFLLRSFLPLAADAGANALLLEYEDMFPYQGKLANLSATNAYSVKQVRIQYLIHCRTLVIKKGNKCQSILKEPHSPGLR